MATLPTVGKILHMQSLILFTCLLLSSNCDAINRDEEKAILLSFQGDWDKPLSVNWKPIRYKDHCNWPGIICRDGFVIGISLPAHGLNEFPSAICSLKKVLSINLSHNNISGSYPTVLYNCSNLRYLDLSENRLVGSLPSNFGRLSPRLKYLNIACNSLSGNIPSSVGQLQKLRNLYLDRNLFDGSYPAEIGNISDLRVLRLGENPFYCRAIHPQFGNLTNLEHLLMNKMNVIGKIPDAMSNANNIRIFDLSGNQLNETIPSWIWSLDSLVVLRLGGNLLSGQIIGSMELSNLVEIDISFNKLSGQIPNDIGEIMELETLFLSDNQFAGSIPESISFLPKLSYLILSNNFLTGPLPQELGKYSILNYLNLSCNQLSGQIPPLLQKEKFKESFLHNPDLCTSNHYAVYPICHDQRWKKILFILFLVLGLTGVLFILLLGSSRIRGFFQRKNENTMPPQWKLTTFHNINFNYQDILHGLADNNLIGSGGSGKVYKICLNDTTYNVVAAKKICNDQMRSDMLEKHFQAEIEILGCIRHTNIVKLLGCMSSTESKVLIYEFMENNSLYHWLHHKDMHRNDESLNWPRRMSIAIESAKGLYYMHHDCSAPIAHRDVKSSNIRLDCNFKAKVADFGLARVIAKGGEPESVSAIVGSFGYMAPEFIKLRKINEKVDVYSFGVVVLELTTGRCANGGGSYENLAQWAWRQFQDEGFQLIDVIDEDIRDPAYFREEQMVFKLGLICTATQPSSRPSMKEVLQVLQR
uniref:non-specific serine/threonine protein kinase n=1 Tax=Oryza brachyantha TaxID=4533 RepID=J3MF07_ORYBR